MSALGDALGAVRDLAQRAGVEWYLFGAQAVAVRASPRATQDIDVTLVADDVHIDALLAALREHGFEHRYPDLAGELRTAGHSVPVVHLPTRMEVDLVVAGSGLEHLALARATPVLIEGVEVPVAHPTDLVVMKILAGRGKDLDDVRALLATGAVDVEEARDLLAQLEEAIDGMGLVDALTAALDDVGRR